MAHKPESRRQVFVHFLHPCLQMIKIHDEIVASCLPTCDDTALDLLITNLLQKAWDYKVAPHSSARGPTYVNPYSRGPYYAADDGVRPSYVHYVPSVPHHLQDKTGCVHLFRGLLMSDLREYCFYFNVSAVRWQRQTPR